ncbi:MAG: hypothetical protein IJE92_01185 [Clostridia bacterium]|nr:hypothetical protein [Clostridia bacterium]
MKVKVMKAFRDKHSGKIHKVGSTLTISKERFEEIRKVDATLVEEVTQPQPQIVKETPING